MKLSLILLPPEMIADDDDDDDDEDDNDDEDDGVATHVNPKCQAACQPRVGVSAGPESPGYLGITESCYI